MVKVLERRRVTPMAACSWCNRIRIADGSWKALDIALPAYTISDIQTMSQITHGICEDCYEQVNTSIPA